MQANQLTDNTHTRLTALCLGLPGWAGTRKVKPIWILLKQETVSGSGISWTICKSAPRSRQTTMPAPHHSVFYRPNDLPAAQPTASKHWRQVNWQVNNNWEAVRGIAGRAGHRQAFALHLVISCTAGVCVLAGRWKIVVRFWRRIWPKWKIASCSRKSRASRLLSLLSLGNSVWWICSVL